MRPVPVDALVAERERMVRALQRDGYLRTAAPIGAMRRVRRHLFVPELAREAYRDVPMGIGSGQTISAPHMVAMMLEALDAQPGMRVLEVGSGSGYHAALVAELVAPGGRVVTVERFPDLAERARRHLEGEGYGSERVEVVVGDGSLGWPPRAPYDRAYLTCAAPALPQAILDQLTPDGVLLAPVGSRELQELVRAERTPHGVVRKGLGNCMFVPLVGAQGFPEA